MRALVTGCAGFIGSHLTEALLSDGDSVVGVDCFNDNYGRPEKLRNLEQAKEWHAFDFVPIDLARGDLADLVADCDVVFHMAAEPGVRASWGRRFDAYLRNNVLATQHLLEAAAQWPEKRFVYASSSSVYGQAESFPTSEDTTPKPFSPYGTTKLAAEHLCQLYHGNHGLATVCLRLFSVYGPRQRPDMAFAAFCRAALSGEPLRVFGDGGQSRDFTYVGDVVRATRSAATAPAAVGGVYNIGGGSQITLLHAIELIQEFAGEPLKWELGSTQHGDVRHTGADTTRAETDLQFRASTPFEEGLKEQFDWMRLDKTARAAARIATT
jgi:UDP-glucuronate 4-epimerase